MARKFDLLGDRKLKQMTVTFDGARFIALRDGPGIPGNSDGWQVLSSRGPRGGKGPRGERGDQGEPGDPPKLLARLIEPQRRYRASPRWSNGTTGPDIELRDQVQQFIDEMGLDGSDMARRG